MRSVDQGHKNSSANVKHKCPESQDRPNCPYIVQDFQNWMRH